MILIAHRGNLRGPEPELENSPLYVDAALAAGCDVEVDLWLVDRLWMLGHDEPQHIVAPSWLFNRRDRLWVHCKHWEALDGLAEEKSPLNWFWHESDDHTLTSHGYIWTAPGRAVGARSVAVHLDLRGSTRVPLPIYGLCTDYPLL